MVRAVPGKLPITWEQAPLPLLVVEVLSGATRRRDLEQKRAFYMDAGVPEYWAVDASRREILVVRRGQPDEWCAATIVWPHARPTNR